MDQTDSKQNSLVQSSIPIIYYSRTGQTRTFIKKLREKIDVKVWSIDEDFNLLVGKQYILITPTYKFGEVPEEVVNFLKDNSSNLIGVIASGNRNWGMNFAKAGELISSAFQVPLIHKYELAGSNKDVDIVVDYLVKLEESYERFD